jgi:hypothetical protein
MGVRKKDNSSCAYHSIYPLPSGDDKLSPRKKGANKSADKSRKSKVRKEPIIEE